MAELVEPADDAGGAGHRVPLPGRIYLTAAMVNLTVGLFTLAPALPAIQAAAASGGSASLVGAPLVGSIAGLSYALTAIFGGRLPQRLGYRRVLVGALVGGMAAGLAGAAGGRRRGPRVGRLRMGRAADAALRSSGEEPPGLPGGRRDPGGP